MEKFWLNFVLEFPGTCNRCPYQACACEFKYETFCNRCPYCILHIFVFEYFHIRLLRVDLSMKLFAPFVTVVFGSMTILHSSLSSIFIDTTEKKALFH